MKRTKKVKKGGFLKTKFPARRLEKGKREKRKGRRKKEKKELISVLMGVLDLSLRLCGGEPV